LNILKWARVHKCPWDTQICSQAVAGGVTQIFLEDPDFNKFETLRSAQSQHYHWKVKRRQDTEDDNKDCEVLQWAIRKGCPWDQQACSKTAKAGRLKVLEWALENGCPWSKANCRHTANCNG